MAIMQPTYLPWMGYLDMIDQADLFVLLDTVAVARQSWQTRNRVLDRSGNVVWLPIPTNARMGQPLNEVRISMDDRWRRKHPKTIAGLGGRISPRILDCYQDVAHLLVYFTARILGQLCWTLGITTPMVWASSFGLPAVDDPVERVQAIFEASGSDLMLSTQGGRDYGVPTRWHEYEPQPYEQNGGPFFSHLSVVDCLARHGPEETARIIRSGRVVHPIALKS